MMKRKVDLGGIRTLEFPLERHLRGRNRRERETSQSYEELLRHEMIEVATAFYVASVCLIYHIYKYYNFTGSLISYNN